MRIELENIGPIIHADLQLEGLTLIAGHNDMGKSYIGKTLFSVVKMMNEGYGYGDDIIEGTVSRLVNFKAFYAETHENSEVLALVDTFLSLIDQKEFNGSLHATIAKLTAAFDTVHPSHFSRHLVSDIQHSLRVFTTFIDALGDKSKIYKGYLGDLIGKVFRYNLNRKAESQEVYQARIRLSEPQHLLDITLAGNEVVGCETPDRFSLQDAVFLNDPTVIDLTPLVMYHLAFSESTRTKDYLPYYTLDLFRKLTMAVTSLPKNEVYDSISGLIKGELVFVPVVNRFVFRHKEKGTIDAVNTAAGIKAFGLLQVLHKVGGLNPRTVLIIDEPEVHLHPEWQLEYAKVLIQLSKIGIPILVTSHSPYFIEAIKVYSDKEKLRRYTRFYSGQLADGGVRFVDATDDLDLIFRQLAHPISKLNLV